jgi:hypothetical protein
MVLLSLSEVEAHVKSNRIDQLPKNVASGSSWIVILVSLCSTFVVCCVTCNCTLPGHCATTLVRQAFIIIWLTLCKSSDIDLDSSQKTLNFNPHRINTTVPTTPKQMFISIEVVTPLAWDATTKIYKASNLIVFCWKHYLLMVRTI